jgi:hypothetical protein
MDRIIALYPDLPAAQHARTELFADGIAADRLDVVAWTELGRVAREPKQTVEDDLIAYFAVVFDDDTDARLVATVVDAIKDGEASLVVHPRGQVEIDHARVILERNHPSTVFWRVAPAESQGGLLGEHAAG